MLWAASSAITPVSIAKRIVDSNWGKAADPVEKHDDRFKQFCQRAAYSLIRDKLKPNHEYRVRHKLARWKLHIPIGISSRRTAEKLPLLASLVAPRAAAAL